MTNTPIICWAQSGAYRKTQIANRICTNAHFFTCLGEKFAQICAHLHKLCVIYTNLGRREATSTSLHKSQIAFTQNLFLVLRSAPLPFISHSSVGSHFLLIMSRARGRGYTVAEIECLLEIIEDILPIGPDDWDNVTQRHCSYYPGLG